MGIGVERTSGGRPRPRKTERVVRARIESLPLRQQKTHFCLPTKVRFLNDVCLWQMMTATPNDIRYANDVCLTAHWGKHRITAERSGATSYLQSKCIISPQAMQHLTN